MSPLHITIRLQEPMLKHAPPARDNPYDKEVSVEVSGLIFFFHTRLSPADKLSYLSQKSIPESYPFLDGEKLVLRLLLCARTNILQVHPRSSHAELSLVPPAVLHTPYCMYKKECSPSNVASLIQPRKIFPLVYYYMMGMQRQGSQHLGVN